MPRVKPAPPAGRPERSPPEKTACPSTACAGTKRRRSPTNGFRCIRHVEPEQNLSNLTRMIDLQFRDFLAETPVPDSVFEFFLRQFRYDPSPLAARLESEEPSIIGRMQTVTLAAAYGSERLTLYLFLPEQGRPPYQAVVVFPGSNAIHTRVFN